MLFGISSTPDVYQRRTHELVVDLEGVEVVADNFVFVGFGDSEEGGSKNHDDNLHEFLQRCDEKNLKLNKEKLKFRQKEVPFIGHIATAEGLRLDPHKVQAFKEMPSPTDVVGVQRLPGLAQYLSKYLPHLADLTRPLRKLTNQDSQWIWEHPQHEAFELLKETVSKIPILMHYNLRGGDPPM